MSLPDPLYNEIDAGNLESVRKNVVFDNLFVGTPFQAKLRRAGVWDPFLGGSAMVEGFVYGRVQGAAVAPGSTVTVTRQQLNTAMKFFPKAYVAWTPLDDWELDDGSGSGGVINSGPTMIVNQYQILMENMVQTINTMIEMDSFRHGQSKGTGIAENRILNSNGLSEALNNGVDPSWDGNYFTTYGSDTRNGAIGPALNSVPLFLGNADGSNGQIDFNALMRMWAQCTVTGGKPTLGITNTFGFVAVANALDSQRRDVNLKKHDINWESLDFNGVEIYADPLAPSYLASDFISLAPTGGKAGNNYLIDGAGMSTQTADFTSPTYTTYLPGTTTLGSATGSQVPSAVTIKAGEVLMFLEPESFKIRPTNKKGWNYGLRRNPMPNNVSMDALFMRLGTNLYNCQPRHNCQAYGFKA
jgi:hypothetical protein